MRLFGLLLFCFLTDLCYGQVTLCSTGYDSTLFDKDAFHIANIIATFPGGDEALKVFVDTKLKPLAKGLSKPVIMFAIDTLGQVKNVCISSDIIRQELNEKEKKIIEIVKTMPNWTSGYSGDKKVPVQWAIRLGN